VLGIPKWFQLPRKEKTFQICQFSLSLTLLIRIQQTSLWFIEWYMFNHNNCNLKNAFQFSYKM
jgi:hypothetical protein